MVSFHNLVEQYVKNWFPALNKKMIGKNYGIAEAIRQDGHRALKPLYKELKAPFIKYMKRYCNDDDIRLDAFHEAMIAFYEYCLAGSYDATKSSPKTLIFRMGHAYLINRLKKRRRMVHNEEMIDVEINEQIKNQFDLRLTDQEQDIKAALKKLGEKCRNLLEMFFYHNFSIDAIKERMQYKNENVVSSHKSRCIKQLKEILQEG